MAKVTRMLLNEAKDKLTDEMFFSSRTMIKHFEKIIEGICKRFHRKLKIAIINTGDSIACTNGNTIMVNLNCDWIKNAESRIEKYYIIVGIILHECGHVLYTDFQLMEKSLNALMHENRLFPKIKLSEVLEEYFLEKRGKKFANIYKTIDNCVEDGHIEKRVIKYAPGYGECLMKVRKLQLSEAGQDTYETMLKEAPEGCEVNKISMLVSLILIYAKYGIDNTGDVARDELTDCFEEVKDFIDKAVKTNNAVLRKVEINKIFDRLIQFIADELNNEEEPPTPPESGSPSDDSENEEDDSSKKDKSDDSKDGSSDDSDDKSSSDDSSEEPEDAAPGEGDGDDGSSSSKSIKEKLDDLMRELDSLCDKMDEKSTHNNSSTAVDENMESEDMGELPEEGSDMEIKGESGPEDWDLSYLEDKAAEEEVSKEIKNKIVAKMKKNADETRKGRTDKFPSIETYADPDSKAIEEYEEQHEECDRIARRVVKNLDKVIKERQKGDKLTGLYTGKSLDSAHAYRKDKKIFSNKVLPEDVPDMEVCVLVDCSGSMSYGTRMEQSRKCAYITWKFCEIMKIPCSVYGHTTDWPNEKHVLMTCCAHPENIDKDDAKRIFMLRPQADNRDGWALNFCAEALSKSKATSKLLLVISDGVPAAVGYGATLGKRDCQEVVRRYMKKGITVVTAGIDDCAKDIRNIYLDGVSSKESAKFLDYSDMSQLPKAFATLIKKELL